ncbi:MAG TPA: IS110 family transposase [Terracidiphilus sp.]|nr:IS110 family transposase [Terracidiphilus sp.]
MAKPIKGRSLSLECIEPNAAGIDVGATEIYVAVSADRDAEPVRCFKTFTGDLQQMAAWLKQAGITTVAMESTGVYWIPPYEILEEAGIRVCLVNSHYVRNVPGRKSDVSDCQWLQYLHSVGLLRPSFRPDAAICALRSLSRHRASLVESAAVHIQHMHKALTQMNLQIHHVLSDVTGISGMAILEAIVAGQRDPLQLAGLCHAKVHADRQTVVKSLTGNYRPEHLFTLKQSLAAYKNYQQLLAECDQEIQRLTNNMPGKIGGGPSVGPKPTRQKRRKNQFHFDIGSELHRLFGVDLTAVPGINAITAHTLLAEVGPDLSRFPSADAFANWLALCPGNKKSGGRVLSSKTRPTSSRLSHALRVAAQTLARSRTYLGNFYRAMRARLGAPQAITAAAHKLARILYHLLTTGDAYDESVFAREQLKQNLRLQKRLAKQAQHLGFQLIPIATEGACS